MENKAFFSRLTFFNVSEQDYGNYTCVASNQLGNTNASMILYGEQGWGNVTPAMGETREGSPSHLGEMCICCWSFLPLACGLELVVSPGKGESLQSCLLTQVQCLPAFRGVWLCVWDPPRVQSWELAAGFHLLALMGT